MKEYIEKAAVLSYPIRKDHCDKEHANEHFIFGIESVMEYVENLPAADVVEVRHGRWLDKGWDGDFSWQIDGRGSCWRVYECSECQCKTSAKTDYCPNCGARMDKEDEHEAD